jgi:hypothetical protein
MTHCAIAAVLVHQRDSHSPHAATRDISAVEVAKFRQLPVGGDRPRRIRPARGLQATTIFSWVCRGQPFAASGEARAACGARNARSPARRARAGGPATPGVPWWHAAPLSGPRTGRFLGGPHSRKARTTMRHRHDLLPRFAAPSRRRARPRRSRPGGRPRAACRARSNRGSRRSRARGRRRGPAVPAQAGEHDLGLLGGRELAVGAFLAQLVQGRFSRGDGLGRARRIRHSRRASLPRVGPTTSTHFRGLLGHGAVGIWDEYLGRRNNRTRSA